MSDDQHQFPRRIKIQRLEDYHTHFCGRILSSGNLFLGVYISELVKSSESALGNLRCYAVVFEFTPDGKFFRNTHRTGDAPHTSYDELQGLVDPFGAVEYCDIEVDFFDTIIDGIRFGLIPNPEFGFIDLQLRAEIAFYHPWDGDYYT